LKRLIAVLVILLVLVGGGAYLYFPRGGDRDAAVSAALAILNTDITAQRSNAADFTPALDGDLFATGDLVKSSAAGRAVLTFFDGSTLTVETGSIVKVTTLNRLPDGGIQLTIEQTLGRTWATVSKLKTPDSKFEIKTPTSTAAVRGTAFETTVTQLPDGTTRVNYKADSGELSITANAGGTTTVPANNQLTVDTNQPAPATASPIPPGPGLRLVGTDGLGYALIAPSGATCGSAGNRAEIPGCLVSGNTVTIRAPDAGRYVLWMTAAAALTNATVKVDALRGTAPEATQTFTRTFALGDLVRTAFTYGAATPQSLSAFEPAEQVTSVCGAQATGKVFSAGTVDERYSLLKSFSASNKNTPVSLVVTQNELAESVARAAATDPSSPVAVKDVAITIDGAGVHLTGNAATPVGTFGATADVIAGPVNGKLVLRLRNLTAGPVPGPILDQLQTAVEKGLNDFTDTFPMAVRQVALRTGCMGIMGTTPQ
jgi:hypothetical protein